MAAVPFHISTNRALSSNFSTRDGFLQQFCCVDFKVVQGTQITGWVALLVGVPTSTLMSGCTKNLQVKEHNGLFVCTRVFWRPREL